MKLSDHAVMFTTQCQVICVCPVAMIQVNNRVASVKNNFVSPAGQCSANPCFPLLSAPALARWPAYPRVPEDVDHPGSSAHSQTFVMSCRTGRHSQMIAARQGFPNNRENALRPPRWGRGHHAMLQRPDRPLTHNRGESEDLINKLLVCNASPCCTACRSCRGDSISERSSHPWSRQTTEGD